MLQLIHSCSVSRNLTLGTNGRTQLQQIATGISCLALPMSPRSALQNSFDLGRAYDFYFAPGTDVKVGDKLSLGSDTYVVSGKENFDVPIAGHLHVMASQEVN